jgi:hypothetical protein
MYENDCLNLKFNVQVSKTDILTGNFNFSFNTILREGESNLMQELSFGKKVQPRQLAGVKPEAVGKLSWKLRAEQLKLDPAQSTFVTTCQNCIFVYSRQS